MMAGASWLVHHGVSVCPEPRVLHPRPNAGQHGAGRHERRSASGRHAWPELHFPAAGGCARGMPISLVVALTLKLIRALTLALVLVLGPTLVLAPATALATATTFALPLAITLTPTFTHSPSP